MVDVEGIPTGISINPGNKYDSTTINGVFNAIIIDTKTYKYRNNNRYKQYFLADKGYELRSLFRLCRNRTLSIKSRYFNNKKNFFC